MCPMHYTFWNRAHLYDVLGRYLINFLRLVACPLRGTAGEELVYELFDACYDALVRIDLGALSGLAKWLER